MARTVEFSEFVLIFANSCFIHLGLVANPITDQVETNLPAAQNTIDTLAMLQEKTKNNLTKEEEDLLSRLLHELRMAYIAQVKQQNEAPKEKPKDGKE